MSGQVYPGEHQGILRKSTFDKVQSILNENQLSGPNRSRNKYNHLLKGLIRCGACGTAYVPTVTRKGSKVYRYYVCSGAQKNGFKSCPHPSISAHTLEHLIVQQIRVIGQDKKLQAAILKQVRKATRKQRASLGAEEKTLRSNVSDRRPMNPPSTQTTSPRLFLYSIRCGIYCSPLNKPASSSC